MKIKKIKINNYRLLKNFEIDLEKELSLIIGKNNSGKTSFLSILDKFIGSKASSNPFSYDDFNINFQKKLKEIVDSGNTDSLYNDKATILGISLKIFIEYYEDDDLSSIDKVMIDLDPSNNVVLLVFEYLILEDKLKKLIIDFKEYEKKEQEKHKNSEKEESETKVYNDKKNIFCNFMKKNHKHYFTISKKSTSCEAYSFKENYDYYIDLKKENISLDKIINLKIIQANRNVSNNDSDKSLSTLSSKYYEKKEEKDNTSEEIQKFKETLSKTDEHLDTVYNDLFDNVIKKVKHFGGIKKGDTNIKIISSLQHKELLKGNTTVMYDHTDEHSLPEYYNGLGYMNLISMIFEIEIILSEFRKENETPSDINLLFIEEPEAHTHPQMQYVFIKNIKNILQKASNGDDGIKFDLQTIITTHSSHITAESDFEDIKYFYNKNKNEVIAKNLRDLEKEYEKEGKEQNYKFLKQYLTLHRAELFFADKAIFIEGDTERILLPAMMKKIDQEDKKIDEEDGIIPLVSQNISIVEVGAYSQIFEKFIDFIGIKSLIITDIDSAKKVSREKEGKLIEEKEKCRVNEAHLTTNTSLKFFINKGFNDLKNLKFENKVLKKENNKWVQNDDGYVLIIYQISEKNSVNSEYHARSFEDSFFHINRQFIIDNKDNFNSLKNIKYFDDDKNDSYDLAEKCIDKKPSFAIEILLNSKTDTNKNEFINWKIPAYIKEGLKWLKIN